MIPSINKLIQNGEVSKAKEAPPIARDNGLYLSNTRVVRLWSMK